MKILIACEYSGIVREAFKALGHNAWSCDLLPTEIEGNHLIMDNDMHLKDTLYNQQWDLVIAHPPCTHLAVSGARYFKEKIKDGRQQEAIIFFMMIANAPVNKIAIENPISIMSTKWRKPDQIIQPWQFGHGETKATCLWLKNLPKLTPSDIVTGREQRVWKLPPSKDRWKLRSTTLHGIAEAMANQWNDIL